MKVYERYPAWMKLYREPGLRSLTHPLRLALSRLYRLHPMHRTPEVPGYAAPPGDPWMVSIGNIEWGGAGKTPCALTICDALSSGGYRPVVVTRGYRSEAERSGPYIVASRETRVGPEGVRYLEEEGLGGRVIGYGEDRWTDSLARLIGDEACLYRSRGVPVVVDRVRERGVEIATRLFRPTHLILDDAFQYRELPRDTDILLLDHGSPFGSGGLLPLGSLRERPRAVRRADIVVFTRAVSDRVPAEAAHLVEGKPVFFSDHRPAGIVARSGEALPLKYLRGKNLALVSGIARPDSFEATVESIGASPAVSFRFSDHHRYRPADVSWMLERMEGGCTFVTTEKDLMRMGSLFPSTIDLVALGIEMEIRDLDRLIECIRGGGRITPDPAPPGDTTSS